MSARRQASTTSLAKFARAHSPDFADNSLDFCNAFWGANDAGVEVLFARMRGALRTTEELRNFWKERYVQKDNHTYQFRIHYIQSDYRGTIWEEISFFGENGGWKGRSWVRAHISSSLTLTH